MWLKSDLFRSNKEAGNKVVGPSDRMAYGVYPERALTIEEILMIVEEFGNAARRAKAAGFDMVEIMATGGYLINRFMTPWSNQRTDEYGGSVDNRLRLFRNIVEDIQTKCGDDFPIVTRINGDDEVPGGNTLEDMQVMSAKLQDYGIAMIDVLARLPEVTMSYYTAPEGFFVHLAEGIKKAVSIPVCSSIRIQHAAFANQIIKQGRTDMVSMARALIADPELPNKAKEGRLEDIRECIVCCRCADNSLGKMPIACSVNPQAAKEAELAITPAAKPKKVAVVGGGVAGMEAARVASLRGHNVVLYEEGKQLGGLLLLAAVFNPELESLLNVMTREIGQSPVQVKLGEEATVASLKEMKPDVIILASGGIADDSSIPGANRKNVLTLNDAMGVMSGSLGNEKEAKRGLLWQTAALMTSKVYSPSLIRKALRGPFPFGKRVVINNGGFAGCEVAEILADAGKTVTLVDEEKEMGYNIGIMTKFEILGRLQQKHVDMRPETTIEAITSEGVKVRKGDSSETIGADTVVLVKKLQPDQKLANELKKIAPVVMAGDPTGFVRETMESGFRAGLAV